MASSLALSIPEVVPYSALSVERKLQIDKIIEKLRVQDSTTLIYFGTEGQANMIQVASQLISEFSDVEDTGVAEVHKQVENLNISLAPRIKKKATGFLGYLMDLTRRDDETPIDTKEVTSQLHSITTMIDKRNGDLMKRNIRYDDMLEALAKNVISVTDYIIALDRYLEELEAERQTITETDPTLRALRIQEIEHTITRIEKKRQMFQISRTKSLQDMLQIRVIQQNNETLTDSLHTLKVVVLPILWTQLLVKTGMRETSDGLRLIDCVNATTAALMQSNLEETRSLTARLSNADGVDALSPETLQEMNRQVVAMVQQSKETVGQAYVDLEKAKTSLEEGEKMILEALRLSETSET